nr:immunoglobulin light chain junction region [Macaca mulatta]MPO13459.1 immunoglobulin light chain junction region [Macaca mulatta]
CAAWNYSLSGYIF